MSLKHKGTLNLLFLQVHLIIKSLIFPIAYQPYKIELDQPYLPTIACKEHQAYHQKTLHLTDLPIMVCTLLLQAEPSNVYPQQAQQWLVAGTGITDQFQSPATMAHINKFEEKRGKNIAKLITKITSCINIKKKKVMGII